jgi:hypothetical protein
MTMASETTALVMCIYRRPHLLEGALRDLRAQSRRADQVVLINNPPYAPHPSVAVAGQRIKGPNMQRECLVESAHPQALVRAKELLVAWSRWAEPCSATSSACIVPPWKPSP